MTGIHHNPLSNSQNDVMMTVYKLRALQHYKLQVTGNMAYFKCLQHARPLQDAIRLVTGCSVHITPSPQHYLQLLAILLLCYFGGGLESFYMRDNKVEASAVLC